MKSERELKVEWLSRSKPLRLQLISLKAVRLERLSRADYGGITYGERNGHGSGNSTETKYAAIAETDAEITEVERELLKIESEIGSAIDAVPSPVCQAYLRMRFLAYSSERKIADELGYSLHYIDNVVRKKAIDSVKIVGNSG